MSRTSAIGAVAAMAVAVLLLALAGGTSGMPGPPAHQIAVRDIMEPALRAGVEELRAAVAVEPTTAESLPRRMPVLWRWANAVALSGQPIPQELPVLAANSGLIAEQARAEPWLRAFDGWVRELEVKESDASALGALRLSHAGPLPVRSWQTLEQTWTVGSLGMAEGGVIAIGIDGFNDQGVLQTADPTAPNFLAIRSTNPNARFTPGAGGPGLSLTTRLAATFTLDGTSLAPGEQVTLVYGDRSAGSPGFELQSWSIDEAHLPVYLDLEATGALFTPSWPSFEVVGAPEVAAVRAIAPSVVRTGEPFSLAIRAEDRYYNRVSGSLPAWELLRDGELERQVPSGDRGLIVVDGLRIDAAGTARYEVRSADGSIAGTSNPIWVDDEARTGIFWGDTHGHTRYAEGQGSPEHYFRFGRDDARLDFLVLSEHDIWTDDLEWQTMRELATRFLEEGRFVPILGYEWTVPPQRGGHHNVLFRGDAPYRVSAQVAPELDSLFRGLRRTYSTDDVLTIPHAHAPGDWRVSDPELERLVEIASTHGTFEFFGNRYLEQGWEIGFVGSSDNHHGHPGYPDTGTTFHTERAGLAAVLAPAVTRDDLFSALRERRAYATSGERMLLDVRMAGAAMGTRLDADAERRISVRTAGTSPIDRIEIVKNGTVVYQRRYLDAALTPDCSVQVSFASSSEVTEYERPRGRRNWRGTLEVAGARLSSVRVLSLENRHRERVERRGRAAVDFVIQTRGRANVLLLELTGAGPSTRVDVLLDEGSIAEGSQSGTTLPAARLSLPLAEATPGELIRVLPVPRESDRDTVSLRIVAPSGELDRELEWQDLETPAAGDYYYVRVTQIDGERAWSSPFWVGGAARQGSPRGQGPGALSQIEPLQQTTHLSHR